MAKAEMQGMDPLALRANKLELVERLADDLAHEIKNPLHSMVINLEVLKRKIERLPEPGDLMRYTGVLGGELDRLSARVDLLLRLIRPNRSEDPVSLPEVVEELLEVVELERERRGVRIDYQPAAIPLLGGLPRDTARQLTLNLFLAALELTPSGGTIRVASESNTDTQRLELRTAPPLDGGVEPPEQSPRLTVARALAEGLGGSLARSAGDPGSGAVLTLTVPARPG